MVLTYLGIFYLFHNLIHTKEIEAGWIEGNIALKLHSLPFHGIIKYPELEGIHKEH